MVDTSGSVDSEHMLKIDFVKVSHKKIIMLKYIYKVYYSIYMSKLKLSWLNLGCRLLCCRLWYVG